MVTIYLAHDKEAWLEKCSLWCCWWMRACAYEYGYVDVVVTVVPEMFVFRFKRIVTFRKVEFW